MATSTQSNDWVLKLCGTCTLKSIDIRRVAEKVRVLICSDHTVLMVAEEAHDRGDYGRVPRSPKMALTPTHSAPGATMNRSAEMAIAVSIVYYLEDATLRNLDMVVNCQIGLISQDGPADAQRAIFEAMLASGLDQPLFNFRVKDTWKCELWVINQDYISSTMYRFVDGIA
ncbi:hypothetical protein DOTSEDRAFT_31788 [Dothistroma septosporum NZE10]|uniref:Uncharacterized protein n=1 Tax=Dothistroma septosporum (strain NZE10 / CBS 128990) TaxID=675120 RepID=N1PWH1_DOTSN|nr:hypothetical protein DOTSEDRAFT_31788 [Dothistroma septosporum NZE10]